MDTPKNDSPATNKNLKIALIGYGKMGKAIEEIAISAGHQIVSKISNPEFNSADLSNADVAIEFTKPAAAKSRRPGRS